MKHALAMLGHAGLLFALVSCGDDGFEPNVESVAGTYHATTFTFDGGSGATDLLAAGASVTITLAPDGSTSGRMLVPGVGEEGGDLDADLAGTWSLSGTAVTFDQGADTFMRDIPFTVSPSGLQGQAKSGNEVAVLVLTK